MHDAQSQLFIIEHANDDVRTLALQAAKFPHVDITWALRQIAGRQYITRKMPQWAKLENIEYPDHLPLEQCSSEQTAMYKREIVSRLLQNVTAEHTRLVDLTGGLGIDFSVLAPLFTEAVYVERNAELCRLAQHNFSVLNLEHISIKNADSIDVLQSENAITVCFIDPARRDGKGQKKFALCDCSPNVVPLVKQLLQKATFVLLKLSPMLDWKLAVAQLNAEEPCVSEVHVVAVENECKELLLLLHKNSDKIGYFCVDDAQISFSETDLSLPQTIAPQLEAGMFLYEPNASLMKLGAFGAICQRFGVAALDNNSHLFVSRDLKNDFLGRKFTISAISSLNKQEIKRLGISQANIATRNFPMSVSDLRKRLKMREGGENYLFATTYDNQHVLLVCRKQ